MAADDLEAIRCELSAVRAERDALRRDLGDLRTRLCIRLGILRKEAGPQGTTIVSVATDPEIVEEVQRLQDELATDREADRRWSAIDALILENRRIHAIQSIRSEFGTSLRLAVDLLDERYIRLRRRQPDGFSEIPDTYRTSFDS
ncbi:hypothetical protein OG689_02285 [Kitasatospora sp. NBC_00240]|uniref:hypothetical protein n=1 Tax=Kitasatospora sp. NBC_00240 TaxID=2903567 RepID=UPI00224EC879|nr:hypothetical protein [Kitasatospora sp. NBC_00240]MCX5208147.1 hypothetical protein [Kitasatospora sp. NBC_00240]